MDKQKTQIKNPEGHIVKLSFGSYITTRRKKSITILHILINKKRVINAQKICTILNTLASIQCFNTNLSFY